MRAFARCTEAATRRFLRRVASLCWLWMPITRRRYKSPEEFLRKRIRVKPALRVPLRPQDEMARPGAFNGFRHAVRHTAGRYLQPLPNGLNCLVMARIHRFRP